MAYKFQRGTAILSGALDQQGDILVQDGGPGTDPATVKIKLLSGTGNISGSGTLHIVGATTLGATLATTGSITAGAGVVANGAVSAATTVSGSGLFSAAGGLDAGSGRFTVSAAGAVVGASLNNSAGGITNAGSIAGATSIDGTGDLTMGTVTMTGFSVDADGDTVGRSLTATLAVSGNTLAIGANNVTADVNGLLTAKNIRSVLELSGASVAIGDDKFTVTAAGAVVAASLNNSNGGITNAGAIAGATTIDASGDLTVGTITNTNFTVSAAGAVSGAVGFSGDNLEFSGTSIKFANAPSASITPTTMLVGRNGAGELQVESLSSVVSALAGAGLTATDGVLSTDGGASAQLEDGTTLLEGNSFATGSAGGTVFLPSPEDAVAANRPSAGDMYRVKAAGVGEIIIKTSGSAKIDGESQITLESPYAAVTVVYMSGSGFGEEYAIV